MEAEYAELVGDEVRTPEEEGLEWHEDGRSLHPSKWGRGKLQRAEANPIARARHVKNGGKVGHPITKNVNAWRLFPTDDANCRREMWPTSKYL